MEFLLDKTPDEKAQVKRVLRSWVRWISSRETLEDEWVVDSIPRMARNINVSPSTLRRRLESKQIKAQKIPGSNDWRFLRADLDANRRP